MRSPFESPLPAGWRQVATRDAGRIQLGRQRSPKHHQGEHMRPYLRVANVFENRIDISDVYEMNFTPQEFETYRLKRGDVLLNEGQSKELVGRPAIYRDELPGACFTNSLIRFTPNDDVTPEWALLSFRTCVHTGVFQALARWTTNIAHLSAQRLADVPFRVPPLDVQRAIVAEVETQESRIDAGVAALERVQANLKRYRASVLKAACEGRLVPTEAELAREERRDYEPASVLLKRILVERRKRWEQAELTKLKAKGKPPQGDGWRKKYEEPKPPDTSDLPELPEGWCWATVETVGDVLLGRRRAPEYVDGEDGRSLHPYVRVANVRSRGLDLRDLNTMPFSEKEVELYRLLPGDIILCEGQSPELVGQSAVFAGGIEDLCLQATVHRFRALPGGPSSRFAQTVFAHHLYAGVFMRAASLTTNIAHLTLERLKPIRFPLAPRAEQDRIVAELDRRLSVADAVEEAASLQRVRSGALRQSTLRAAFSGQLQPSAGDP